MSRLVMRKLREVRKSTASRAALAMLLLSPTLARADIPESSLSGSAGSGAAPSIAPPPTSSLPSTPTTKQISTEERAPLAAGYRDVGSKTEAASRTYTAAPRGRDQPSSFSSEETKNLGPDRGFTLRYVYTPSIAGGTFEGSQVSLTLIEPLAVGVSLGGRIGLTRRLTLALGADIGFSAISLMGVDGFNSDEARGLGVPVDSDPDGQAKTSNRVAVQMMSISAGPSIALELALTSSLTVFARPSLTFGVGLPMLQNGTRAGPIKDPDGFLNEKSWTTRAVSLEGGVLLKSGHRYWTLGVGWRGTNYAITDLPGLYMSGAFLTLGVMF